MSEHYGIASYKVCSNGAVVVDERGKILQAIPVPMEVATRLYEMCIRDRVWIDFSSRRRKTV